MAVRNRHPENDLIFHPDKGVQYCSELFRALIKRHCPCIRQSMSRKGNCWDNACAESFFKSEPTYPVFTNGVVDYIQAYYNQQRIHSALDYASPDEYSSHQVA